MKGRTLLVALGAVVLTACEIAGIEPGARNEQVHLEDHLSPAVLPFLRPDGLMEVERPPAVVNGTAIISPSEAQALAEAYVASLGHLFVETWEADHGGSIEIENLVPEGRVFFADTPYGSLGDDVPTAVKKEFGPYYLIRFRDQAHILVLSVAVSAFNTDLRIEEGQIVFPLRRGNDFFPGAIPRGSGDTWPLSPERALTDMVGRFRRATVGNVPRLLLPRRPYAPQLASWQVELTGEQSMTLTNAPADVVGSKVAVASEFGRPSRSELLRPKQDQPTALPVRYLHVTGEDLDTRAVNQITIAAPVRSGLPVYYDTIARGAN